MKKLFLFLMILASTLILTSCDTPEESAPHTHEYKYSYDTVSHWMQCSCGDKKDSGNHDPLRQELTRNLTIGTIIYYD